MPPFTPYHIGFTSLSTIASHLAQDLLAGQNLSFSYSALTGMLTPPLQQAPIAFTVPVTTTDHLSSSIALSEQLL